MSTCKEIKNLETELGFPLSSDLHTVFNARRWNISNQKDKRKSRTRLQKYFLNREVLLAGVENLMDEYSELDLVANISQYLRMSQKKMNVNSVDNSITLIIQLGNIDYHALPLIFSSRQLTTYYILTGEYLFQQVMRQEAVSNRQSGITILYDMEGLKVSEYLNPFSPMMQMFTLSSTVLQENYLELVNNLFIVNAGSFVKIAMKLMKLILFPKALEKVKILSEENWKDVLLEHIEPSALPIAYGGTMREDNDDHIDPETCCHINKPIPKPTAPNRWASVNMMNISIKPGAVKEVGLRVENTGVMLNWVFKTSAKIEFTIMFKKESNEAPGKLLIPRLLTITPFADVFPESGSVKCEEEGYYNLHFHNTQSKFFSINVSYYFYIE